MKTLQYRISSWLCMEQQKENSSFPTLTQTGLELKQVFEPEFHFLSRSSQLGLTGVNKSVWERIWVLFPSNGFISELRNREKQRSALRSGSLQRTEMHQPQSPVPALLKSLLQTYFFCWYRSKRQKTPKSVKSRRVQNLLSMKLCLTLPGVNVTQELWCGTERSKFKMLCL